MNTFYIISGMVMTGFWLGIAIHYHASKWSILFASIAGLRASLLLLLIFELTGVSIS